MQAIDGKEPVQGGNVSDSLIRIELITHFHCNPGLEGTCEELAQRIGRDVERVESQMGKLVLLNILDERMRDGERLYSYVPPFSLSPAAARAGGGRLDRRREENPEGEMRLSGGS